MKKPTTILTGTLLALLIGTTLLLSTTTTALRSQPSPLIDPTGGTTPPYPYYPPIQRNTISVTGHSEMDVEPDQAIIHLSIVSEAKTAKDAQNKNSQTTETVKKALTNQGVTKEDIETESYYLHKKERWDPLTQRSVFEGYVQTHNLKITAKNLEKLGAIIDAAVQAGVNTITNVAFDLSKKKRATVNAEALTIAAIEAKGKAESLAKALNVNTGQLISVSENNYAITPYYADYQMARAAAAEEAAPTPDLSPKKVNVNLNVNVVYEIIQ